MPDDLLDRLRRLAPTVDEDAALAALEGPAGPGGHKQGPNRRRGVVMAGAALGLVVVLVATAVVVTRLRDDRGQTVTAGPTTTAVPATAAPLTASTTLDGIELTVTLPTGRVEVGERVRAEVVIRNVGTVPVLWTHGGCVVPASVVLTATGAPVDPVPFREPAGWDGVAPLAERLRSHNALAPAPFVDPKSAGLRTQACRTNLIYETIAPGGETRWAGATDARVPPGSLAPHELLATFVGYSQPGDYPRSPRPPVEVRVAVPVLDDAARAPSADPAVDAFAADPRLQQFVDRTRHELDDNPVTVTQSWQTELSWWQSAWELWIMPQYNGDEVLRLRYDPDAGAVVDARLLSPYYPPGDDPDHNRFPGQPPDAVLP